MNALVMYDHQSDTLWSQFLSRGVKGPLVNTALEIVPVIQTTWQQWSQLHPDTVVLDKGGRYQGDSYEGYYRGGSAGIIGESNKDKRLPSKDLVLGIDLAGAAKAYAFEDIAREPVINDFFAGQEALVTFDPISETGAVFDRRVDGRTLTFAPGHDPSFLSSRSSSSTRSGFPPVNQGDILLIHDLETGSTWQALTGWAIDGPLIGTALKRLPSHYSFWFAWSDFHPDTELYGG